MTTRAPRNFNDLPEDEIRLLHSPFYPAEVYDGEAITAEVSPATTEHAESARLQAWRISPLGIELLMEKSLPEWLQRLRPGLPIQLTVQMGKQRSEFQGLVVATRHREGHRELLGIRWCRASSTEKSDAERREGTRWLCGSDFLPTGIAANPTRFNDFIHFRVRDVSKEGMQLYTSLRNKFVIPGMRLDTMISFPTVGQVNVQLAIANTRIITIDGKDYLSIGARVSERSSVIDEMMGQYLLQYGSATSLDDLRKEGLRVRSVSGALDFGYVKTAREYREVLELRKEAYAAAGKIAQDSPVESAGDIFDSRARIITARHRGKLVGSMRLMFHNPEDLMEHERFLSLPSEFPRKDELVEITRVCTHPSYRGSDLFYGLIKQLMITLAQAKRRWLIGSATAKLMPLYEKIGCRPVGLKFVHGDLGPDEHELLVGDIQRMVSGAGVGAALWNELYADVADYLVDHETIEFDPLMQVRMGLYRAMRPITGLVTRGVRHPTRA